MKTPRPRTIAFYLPQYHVTEENSQWWGKGFTDWTNVKRATPLFEGHSQPHEPELGYYNLLDVTVRRQQAKLARDHGIDAFCYFHYWFQGKRLLAEGVDAILHSGEPDLPFCLCWANENWTRTWDGKENEILIRQEYSPADDLDHMQWLAKAFRDPRYVRVEGKPIFLVYHAEHLPSPEKTARTWRKEALRLGIGEIFLAMVKSFSDRGRHPESLGFDGLVDFQPNFNGSFQKKRVSGQFRNYPYETLIRENQKENPNRAPFFPCVCPSWDNTARRGNNATIFSGSTPELYGEWLSHALKLAPKTAADPLVFINAWNEWAEGNHLEPCQRWSRAYLEVGKQILRNIALPFDVSSPTFNSLTVDGADMSLAQTKGSGRI